MPDAPIGTTLTLGLKKYKDHAKPGAAALNGDKDKVDAAVMGWGTEFPDKYQAGKLFFRTDLRGIFKNTGSQNSPTFTRIFEASTVSGANLVPMADALGKISSDWLKDDVLLADGTRPLTGDLDADGNELKNLKAPSGPNSAARLTDVSGLRRVEADVVAELDANYAIATALENGDTVNGQVLTTGMRVLLPYQTDGKQNGIYVVPASGAASRSTDADTAAELQGLYVIVADGTKWFGPSDAFVLGVDDVVFIEDPATAYTGGQNISVDGTVISVTGLAVPEGGRAVRTTDQSPDSTVDGISTTVVALTTIKSNKNGVFDLGEDPTLYTVKQGGICTFSNGVKLKKGSSGTYARLALVNVDTDEEIAVDERNDRVSNQRNRYLSVSISDDFEAGTQLKLVFETDAADNGKIIEQAWFSGAAQGAGVIGTPEEGTNMADVMLLNSFYEEHLILPATVFQEPLYTYPAPDFQYDGGGALARTMGHMKITNGNNSYGNFGWNLGGPKSRILFRCSLRLTAPSGASSIGIFMCNSVITTRDVTNGYLFVADSTGKFSIIKATSFTELAAGTAPAPPSAVTSQSIDMAAYYDDATGTLMLLVRMGPGAPIKVVEITDSTYTTMQYVGVTWGAPGVPVMFAACPQSIRYDD